MLKAIFWDYHQDERGAWVKCHIPEDCINENYLSEVMHGEIRIDDGRRISSDQRKKIYALCRDISAYTGHDVEDLKENILKIGFMIDEEREYFSLSNVDMTTARYFIEYILNFIFEWDIPLEAKTAALAREINNYLYLCLKHRKCAICGEKGDIHHHSNLIGMGGDRKSHDHTKSDLICLCRKHHTECHAVGHQTFEKKYQVRGIKVNEVTIKKLKL
jgi:hypothetical protein